MDEEFLEEYLKSPEEHLMKFIQENYELRMKILGLEKEIEILKAQAKV